MKLETLGAVRERERERESNTLENISATLFNISKKEINKIVYKKEKIMPICHST